MSHFISIHQTPLLETTRVLVDESIFPETRRSKCHQKRSYCERRKKQERKTSAPIHPLILFYFSSKFTYINNTKYVFSLIHGDNAELFMNYRIWGKYTINQGLVGAALAWRRSGKLGCMSFLFSEGGGPVWGLTPLNALSLMLKSIQGHQIVKFHPRLFNRQKWTSCYPGHPLHRPSLFSFLSSTVSLKHHL